MIAAKGSKHPLLNYYLEDCWPCAGGLSAVNAIDAQMKYDLINSGLTTLCYYYYDDMVVIVVAVYINKMDAAAESWRNPVSISNILYRVCGE